MSSVAAVLMAGVFASSAAAQIDTDPVNNAPLGADTLLLAPGQAIANIAQLGGLPATTSTSTQ